MKKTTSKEPEKRNKDNWQTPKWLMDLISEFFSMSGSWFDPCPANPDFDGLSRKWPERCYINPPFSEYLKWAKHGFIQPLEQIWICHHDSSTERFKILLPGSMLCLLYKRVSFIDPATGKPKSTDPAKSQTLIYRGNYTERFYTIFSPHGFVTKEFEQEAG